MEPWAPPDVYLSSVNRDALRERIARSMSSTALEGGGWILRLKAAAEGDMGVVIYKDPLLLSQLFEDDPAAVRPDDLHVVETRWSYWEKVFASEYSLAPLIAAGRHVIPLVSTTGERAFFQRIGVPHIFPMGGGSWANESTFKPLERRKTFDVCMVAATNMPDSVKRWSVFLDLVGRLGLRAALLRRGPEPGGDEPDVRQCVRERSLERRVAVISVDLPRWAMNEIYNASHFTVLLSEREGFNRSTSESLLAGTPLLVQSESIAVPPGVVNGDTGFFIDPAVIDATEFEHLRALAPELDPRGYALRSLCSSAATRALTKHLARYCAVRGLGWSGPVARHANDPRKVFVDAAPSVEPTVAPAKLAFVIVTCRADRAMLEEFVLPGLDAYTACGHAALLVVDADDDAFDDLGDKPGFTVLRDVGQARSRHLTAGRLLLGMMHAIDEGADWVVKLDSDSALVHTTLGRELARFDCRRPLQLGTPKEVSHVQGGGMILSRAAIEHQRAALTSTLRPGGRTAQGADDVLIGDVFLQHGVLPIGVPFVHCFWKRVGPIDWGRTCIVHSTKDASLAEELRTRRASGGA